MQHSKIIVPFLLICLNLCAHEFTECADNGFADIYPCENIDLLHRVHIDQMGGGAGDTGSDIWGWTDPLTNKEYALTAMSYGTTFVDISNPQDPIYLGKLQTASGNSIWRDIKTYNNHAFIVSEASGHGMQIFDLTQLRDTTNIPVEYTATANYTEFTRAHNIVINEATGFAYAVGVREGTNTCSSGLHMINIQNPTSPVFAGCFSSDGYTHDAQCVAYIGPDNQHSGKEICFNSNEDTLTIVDVSDKNSPVQISRTGYDNSQYTHQGWLTEDQRYYLMNDELDEQNNGHNTKTYIWDLLDLELPQLIGFYNGPKPSIDHNLYIKDNFAYLTNYTSGLSIVDITDIGNANLVEVANFDGFPANDGASFSGAWSNYPYFESGTVIMSDFDGGLFILGPSLCPQVPASDGLLAQANGDNSIDLTWNNDLVMGESYNVFRSEGGCAVDNFVQIATGLSSPAFTDNSVSGQVNIGYKVSKFGSEGVCESNRSVCVEASTTGTCTAAPQFSGVNSVSSSGTATCGIDIQWNATNGYCGNSISYDVYKSTNPAFIPGDANKVVSDITATQWHDVEVLGNNEYYYVVRARDTGNQTQDNNIVKLSDLAQGVIKNGLWSAGAEVGDGGFNQASRHVGWEFSTTRVNSGLRSYWSQSQSSTCNDLLTNTISLTAGESSQLSFWTAFGIEDRWDGGVVEITTDEVQWDQPNLSPNYPDTFRSSTDACNYAENTPSFTGTNLTWQQHTMDLSSYQGQDIKIRWNYSTDGNTNEEGWFLDDINVTNTQVPSQCNSLIDEIFASGFE